jgi:hypothetical protein
LLGQAPRASADDAVLTVDSSDKTAALSAGTYRICSTVDCWIKVGPAATVVAAEDTAGNAYLPANYPELFVIHDDSPNNAIAAVKTTAASAGTASVTRCTPTDA